MELPPVDLAHLRDLMKLMDEFKFDEIDLREDGRRLHLMRSGAAAPHPPAVVMPTVVHSGGPLAAAAPEAAAAEPAIDPNLRVITSPMVGTFYRQPSPDAATFVEEGQDVNEDTVLCIIEAMKVMNEIKAEHEGQLVKILVANGEAVEYGEPLFHVRVSS